LFQGSASSNRKKLEAVFNSEEDSSSNQAPKRKLVPLDYSEEEKKAVATAKSAEQKKKNIKSLIERIPTAKNELFAYTLDWECVDQVWSEFVLRLIRLLHDGFWFLSKCCLRRFAVFVARVTVRLVKASLILMTRRLGMSFG
jgi:hypothetical protein